MSLTREEVLNVAKLARLEFEPEQIEKFQQELNDILKYIDVLSEVDTVEVNPLSQVNDGANNLRADVVRASLSNEEAMKNVPVSADGTVVVPKVVGE